MGWLRRVGLVLGCAAVGVVGGFLLGRTVPSCMGSSLGQSADEGDLLVLATATRLWACEGFGLEVSEVRPTLESESRRAWEAGARALALGEAEAVVPWAQLWKRLDQMDVVVVSDIHSIPPIQAAFGRLVAGAISRLPDRRIAVACEAVPASWNNRLAMLNGGGRSGVVPGLLSLLAECWPWPLSGYAAWEAALAGAAPVLLAAGTSQPTALGSQPAEDFLRRPQQRVEREWWDRGAWLDEPNENALAAISRYRAEAGTGVQIWVLFGAHHLLVAERGLLPLLKRSGLQACVLVPFHESWETAVRATRNDLRNVPIEVLPNVIRLPVLSQEQIVGFDGCHTTDTARSVRSASADQR